MVWIPGTPSMKGTVTWRGTPRIPNHRAPNHQFTTSWVRIYSHSLQVQKEVKGIHDELAVVKAQVPECFGPLLTFEDGSVPWSIPSWFWLELGWVAWLWIYIWCFFHWRNLQNAGDLMKGVFFVYSLLFQQGKKSENPLTSGPRSGVDRCSLGHLGMIDKYDLLALILSQDHCNSMEFPKS